MKISYISYCFSKSLAAAGGALQELLSLLISRGRACEATVLLREQRALISGGNARPLDPVGLVNALSGFPQTAGITPEDGAALVDAALQLVALPEGPGGVPMAEAISYMQRRTRWAVLELLEEVGR